MTGPHLHFRFEGELNDFLSPERRGAEFEYVAGPTDTLKHIVESLGVPHTEFARVLINGDTAESSSQPHDGDRVDVLPYEIPIHMEEPCFVADGHLGRLAAYLRMLGFDTWYDRYADDVQLASIAGGEHRLLLTRDVGLLKRREVEAGYCVRNHKPHDQLHELTRRFALRSLATPFRRCMDCNGRLDAVSKEEVEDKLPPHTRATKTEFSRCSHCGNIYWRGSHYERMLGWIEALV